MHIKINANANNINSFLKKRKLYYYTLKNNLFLLFI